MVAKNYTNVESNFIRSKIKNGDFDDSEHREYVDDLIEIEIFILEDKPSSMAGGYRFQNLKNKYPEEFNLIQCELDTVSFEERIASEKIEKAKDKIRRSEEKITEIQEKQKQREQWNTISQSQ